MKHCKKTLYKNSCPNEKDTYDVFILFCRTWVEIFIKYENY